MSQPNFFAHLNTYARSSRYSKLQSRQPGLDDVLGEAFRLRGHCSHVQYPCTPLVVFGGDDADITRAALEWSSCALQENGKAWRKDAPIIAAGVTGLPSYMLSEWSTYKELVVMALTAMYDDRLISVVEHIDEPHPHLHFFLVPRLGEGFGAVHPGYAASRAARRSGEGGPVHEYGKAMSSWQDDIFARTGGCMGLERFGPRRRRETAAENAKTKRLSELEERLKMATQQVESIEDGLMSERKRLGILCARKKGQIGLGLYET